jgi:phenylpyruvate tautomerase PptA (4-oxalocrotonate tautomerase family)
MSQIKIYGLRAHIDPIKAQLSDTIHRCVVEALQYPVNKRAHRFFPLEPEDFYYPEGRSEAYTIIELTMITGRTIETKKNLIRLLYKRISEEVGVAPFDVEICIYEVPRHDWGFRGFPGDEAEIDYKVNV